MTRPILHAVIAISASLTASCQWTPGTDQKRAEASLDLVREELIDGSSARFENVVVARPTSGDTELVCGWVNGRNALGAYTGSVQFLVADGKVRHLGEFQEPGWETTFGTCVAGDQAASARLMRDVDRSVEAYARAVSRLD